MNYILLMTSAGSLLFAGYLLLEKAMGKHMGQICRYWMLVVVMLTYLVPWVWLKGVYGIIRFPARAGEDSIVLVSGEVILGDAVIHVTDGFAVTPNYGIKLSAVGLWMTAAALAMLFRCGVYFRDRHALLKRARSCGAGVSEDLVRRLKQECHIMCRVRIVRIPDGKRSFTLGVIRPVVFLQESRREDELEHILRHEFIHIARGDLLVKMLIQLVCCLHWFNPLVYWLERRLDRMCEKACDERVVKDMTEDEKEAYAHLIVKSMKASRKASKGKVLFGSFFTSNDKFAEERIRVIMDKVKRKFWEKIVVAGVFAVLLFVDSLTAMAYPQVYNVEADSVQQVSGLMQGVGMLKLDAAEQVEAKHDNPVLYDAQIVTADGEILPAGAQTRLLCFHKWQNAQYENHIKDDNGGCTITVYSCKYCPRCDTIKIGELLSTHIYTTCEHNY